jgi:EAL domain-containing protein (putative c-di-GMP-specific phosphodiesterase class I)
VIMHPHEGDRVESLRSYGVLDSAAEPAYDALTELAAMICDTPIAMITLVDAQRQWFKSRRGLPCSQTSRVAAFSAYTVAASGALVVADATLDERFSGSDLVIGPMAVRSYAGVPLIGRDGLPLGALCVMDRRPRHFSAEQLAALRTLAHQVMTLLELGRIDQTMGRRPEADGGELTDPLRLRAALDGGEFLPYFQPIVDLATGSPRGFEALLRWVHPQHGLIMPGRFLPAIESSGLIMPVGRHVLREAVRLLAELRTSPTGRGLGVAVNLSLTQLAQPGVSETVIHELQARSVPPELLSLELTESAALFDDRHATDELRALRAAGVNLSIDDYGTGYSSLMRVLDLPISTLKLDRSLIQRLPADRRAMAVAKSTIDMATDLGIAVIAEGIELPEQRETLLALGCHFGQGFLFGRAVPGQEVTAALAAPVAGARAGAADPWWHAVQLYDRVEELTEQVVAYLAPALLGPGAVVVVVTPPHREAFEAALRLLPDQVGDAVRLGRYVVLDAQELLATVMVDGRPDRSRFRAVVVGLIEDLYREHGFVRVYGESVACLWRAGQTSAALDLEDLWNEYAAAGVFSLFCAYPHEVVDPGSEAAEAIHRRHTAVVHTAVGHAAVVRAGQPA